CGKTTLRWSVAGLLQPDSRQILIGGKDVTGMPTRERPIGMVSQSYALFPNMTLRNNIAFPLVVRNVPASEITRRVSELLDLVQLDAQADRYPKQVSAGQQQRTALVRALAPQPDVLLLDEPLSALDALVRHQLRDEIRRIQQAVRTTTIFVTHDQSEAMAIADPPASRHRRRREAGADLRRRAVAAGRVTRAGLDPRHPGRSGQCARVFRGGVRPVTRVLLLGIDGCPIHLFSRDVMPRIWALS